jgi:hypothetical protein
VRLVAVDASTDEERTRRALALALAQAPRRLFLFRAAADAAAAIAQRDLQRRDERFLDVAAAWLLDKGTGEPPSRARLPVPLLEVGMAICDRDAAPLPASSRAIELLGAHIGMALPDVALLDREEIENAALWIAGGAPDAAVDRTRGRLVVVPGDVIAGGHVTVIDVASELRVAFVDKDGDVIRSEVAPLPSQPSLTVQGAR